MSHKKYINWTTLKSRIVYQKTWLRGKRKHIEREMIFVINIIDKVFGRYKEWVNKKKKTQHSKFAKKLSVYKQRSVNGATQIPWSPISSEIRREGCDAKPLLLNH